MALSQYLNQSQDPNSLISKLMNWGAPVDPASMSVPQFQPPLVTPATAGMDTATWGMGSGSTSTGLTTGAPNASEPSFMQGLLGSRDANGMQTPGWGGMALGAFQGLANTYLGMQQYGLAKDTLKANKEQFAKNYEAQKLTTNAALEDRQRARVASNAGAYQSVGDYMAQNGIK